MKKKYYFLITSALMLVITCKKEMPVSVSRNLQEVVSNAPLPDNGNKKNYCKGCGISSDPSFGCMFSFYDPLNNQGVFECSIMICPATILNNYAKNFQIQDSINSQNSCLLRDSLLILTSKGQDYISYAYYLGSVMYTYNTININNIYEHVQFANETREIGNRLLNGNNSEIVLDSNYLNHAISFIRYYQSLKIPGKFNEILAQIEVDLQHFLNKSRYEIWDEINKSQL